MSHRAVISVRIRDTDPERLFRKPKDNNEKEKFFSLRRALTKDLWSLQQGGRTSYQAGKNVSCRRISWNAEYQNKSIL